MRGAFADRRFRRLLIGNSLSTFGDTALYLTLGIWAKSLTHSNAAAGSVFLALGIPALFGPLTGAGFNPARSLGPALIGNHFDGVGRFLLVYCAAPAIGAVAAALLYTYVFTSAGKKGVEGLEPVG